MTADSAGPTSAPRIPVSSPNIAVRATIALIAILFALFVAVLGYSTMRAYDDAQTRARDRADAASQVVAINAQWIVDLAQQALRRIDESLGADIEDGTGETVRDLREAVDSLPGTVKAYVVDADGDTLASTDPLVKPINITDRDYFSELARGAGSYTSPLLVSRLNGEQIFVFSRRLQRNGTFAGAAIISFDVRLFEDIWRSLGLDADSTVSIVRDDGWLVARYPFAPGPLDLSQYVLFTDYLKESDSGTYFAVSPADNISRYVGYRNVKGTHLVALASVSSTSALAAFWRNTVVTLLLALPAAIGLAMAAVWIVRLLQRDARRQAELSRTLEINRLLFRDTHHRVKNNLQSVQSLVRMQNIPVEAKMDLQRRIAAMTSVHEHIYRADQYVEVNAAEFIPAIVTPLLQSFDSGVEVTFDIDPITVDRDHTTALALLVNEVVTNTLKYAFGEGKSGKLSIRLKPTVQNRASLEIADNGLGFDPNETKQGMGSRLIRGMLQQLDGTFEYRREGGTVFACEIAMRSSLEPIQPNLAAAAE